MMHIIEPNTRVKYSLFSYKGRNILTNYIKRFQIGGSKNTTPSSSRKATPEEQDAISKLVERLMKEYKGKVHEQYKASKYKDKEFQELYDFLEKKEKFQDYNKIMKTPLIKGRIYNTIHYWRYKIYLHP